MHDDDMRIPGRVRVEGEGKPLVHRFAKQILMSVLASLIAAMFLNATGIKKAVQYAASIIIHTGGDPLTGKDGLIKDAKEKLGHLPHDPGPLKPSGLPIPLPNPLRKTPEQIAAEAEARRQALERREATERDKWIARAEAVGLEHEDDWTLGDFKVKVPIAEEKARYDADRKSLLASAHELKMIVNDDWDNKTLKEEIKEEKAFQWADSEYQEKKRRWLEAMEKHEDYLLRGPNGKCPNPRCNYLIRFSASRQSTKFVCPKCAGHFTVNSAKACYRPPPSPREPQPPQRKAGLLKRMFG